MINFLPFSQKRELVNDRNFAIVNVLGMTAALILLTFALALFATGVYFDGLLRSTTVEAQGSAKQLEMMQVKDEESQIANYRSLCKNMNDFYSAQSGITNIIERLTSALPSQIALGNLDISGKDVSISGISPDRSILESMQENIEKTPYFKKFSLPASDWIVQENISFNATMEYENVK